LAGLDIVVDDSIETQPEIYMEAGDHETLLHLTHACAPDGERTAWAL
jgi:prolyl-tRNA editing enzyme YbaK/EbsC (Cys-tRNA(Pro) deacylase)